MAGPHPAKDAATAYEVKEVHRQFNGFTDDELRRIPIVPPGSRLEQGATYVDLQDPQLREFTATADMTAAPENWYVPKSEIDYRLCTQVTFSAASLWPWDIRASSASAASDLAKSPPL